MMLKIPHTDLLRGIECCLSDTCAPSCPYYCITDRKQCREALLYNVAEYAKDAEEIIRARDALEDKCLELQDALERLEDEIDG